MDANSGKTRDSQQDSLPARGEPLAATQQRPARSDDLTRDARWHGGPQPSPWDWEFELREVQSQAKPTEVLLRILQRARRLGEPLDRESLLAKFPGLAGAINDAFEIEASESRIAPPLAERLKQHEAESPLPIPIPSWAESMELGVPRRLGQYKLIEEIGRGGMAIVYLARDLELGRVVAVKVLPRFGINDETRRLRFENEARAAAKLDHPNIVPIYGNGRDRGVHYFAMRYVEGRNLAELMDDVRSSANPVSVLAHAETRPHTGTRKLDQDQATVDLVETPKAPSSLPDVKSESAWNWNWDSSSSKSSIGLAYCRRVAEIGLQAARALDHAHRCGVVHRDIKPSNLMLDGEGKLWVTDFGLALTADSSGLTETGDVIGTLRYMSVEQVLGHSPIVDHRTDIYSLGVTLYELLVLRHAVSGEAREEIRHAIGSKNPIPLRKLNPRIPEGLARVIAKAMSRDVEDRYATANAFADDLAAFLEDRPIQARAIPMPIRVLRQAQRNWRIASLVSVSILLGFVGAIIFGGLAFGVAREESQRADQADASRQLAILERDSARREAIRGAIAQQLEEDPYGALQAAAKLAEEAPEIAEPLMVQAWLRCSAVWTSDLSTEGSVSGIQFVERSTSPAEDGERATWLVTTTEGRAAWLGFRGDSRGVERVFRREQSLPESAAERAQWASVISPDGRFAFSGPGPNGPVAGEDVESLRRVELETGETLEFSDAFLIEGGRACFDANGGHFLTGGSQGEGLIWNTARGARVAGLPGGPSRVKAGGFSRDGQRVVLVDEANGIRIHSATGGPAIWSRSFGSESEGIDGERGKVLSAELSRDGRKLLVVTRYRGITIWDVDRPEAASVTVAVPVASNWSAEFLDGDESILLWYPFARAAWLVSALDGRILRRIETGFVEQIQLSPERRRMLVLPNIATLGSEVPEPFVVSLFEDEERYAFSNRGVSWSKIAWSADGNLLAAVNSNGKVEIHRVRSVEAEMVQVEEEEAVPGGSLAVVDGERLGFANVVQPAWLSIDETGRVRQEYGASGVAADATASRDEPLLLVNSASAWTRARSAELQGVVQLIDASSGKEIRRHVSPNAYIKAEWSHDRKHYVLFDLEGQAVLHATQSGEVLWQSHAGTTASIAISPSSDSLIEALPDGRFFWVSWEQGEVQISTLASDAASVDSVDDVVWLNQGKEVLLLAERQQVWHAQRDESGATKVKLLGVLPEPMRDLELSSDASWLGGLATTGPAMAWPLSRDEAGTLALGQAKDGIRLAVNSYAIGLRAVPHAEQFVVTFFDRGPVVWETSGESRSLADEPCAAVAIEPTGTVILVLVKEPQGKLPLVGGGVWSDFRYGEQRIVRYDPRLKELVHEANWQGGLIREIEPARDGGWVIQVSNYGLQVLGESSKEAGSTATVFGEHAAPISSVVPLSEGRWATGSYDQSVRLWNVERGEALGHPWLHDSVIQAMVASPSGDRLAVATHAGTLRIWDLRKEPPVSETRELQGLVCAMEWGNEGRLQVVTSDGRWYRWDESGERRDVQLGEAQILSAVWDRTGERLAWVGLEAMASGIPGMTDSKPSHRMQVRAFDEPKDVTYRFSRPIQQMAWYEELCADAPLVLAGSGDLWQPEREGRHVSLARCDGAVGFSLDTETRRGCMIGRNQVMLFDLTSEGRSFVLRGVLRDSPSEISSSLYRQRVFPAKNGDWWITTPSTGLVRIPGDPLELARSALARMP